MAKLIFGTRTSSLPIGEADESSLSNMEMQMRVFCGIVLTAVSLMLPSMSRAQGEQQEGAKGMVTAFVHVNVIPMDRERVLRNQTVIVTGTTITAMSASAKVPAGARIVDGGGTAYLAPGLADMHTHSEMRNDLAVYLANGVTSVLNMGGARAGFVDSTVPMANSSAIPSPHVYTAFLVDGTPDYNGFVIKTPDQAYAIVDLAKTNGYDFMKVYVGLGPEAFKALASAGKRADMPIVGHGVTAVRLPQQLADGQVMVAHLEEFFYTFFTPAGVEESDTPPDHSRIADAVALAKHYGVTVTADLSTYSAIARQIGHPDVLAGFIARPETAYLSPNDRLAWQRSVYGTKTARLQDKRVFLGQMVKAMADAKVPLIAGTDAPGVPGMWPGFSLHDNMADLEQAGLSRFQVLSIATREPGLFIQRTKGGARFGEVAPGYRADLVMTQANPLKDLGTLRTPLGVMASGKWRDASALGAILDEVRLSYVGLGNLP